ILYNSNQNYKCDINADTLVVDEEFFKVVNGKLYWRSNKSKLPTLDNAGMQAYLSSNNHTLIYQLATPVEIPVQVSGTLVGYSSGTVYWEPMVADAGVYAGKMDILNTSLPIKRIEKLSKVDYATGVEYELDPA